MLRFPVQRGIARRRGSSKRREPRVVVTGGGTAGHALPALAVARALVGRGLPAASIEFVGSRRGVEARLAGDAGFSFTLLRGRGVQRRLALANVLAVGGLMAATARSMLSMARRRPSVVIALGGYASLPYGVSAALLRVPLIVVATDVLPGATSRVLGRFAKACAVAFEVTTMPRALVTGAPVRDAVVRARDERLRIPRWSTCQRDGGAIDGVHARLRDGPPGPIRPLLVAFGGSLGARSINAAVAGMVRDWGRRPPVDVHHVIGSRDWLRFDHAGSTGGNVRYVALEYDDRLPEVLAASDLAICRSGAGTVAELSVIGVASILVPLPGAPRDHQTANARVLSSAGAAVCMSDADLDGKRLTSEVMSLLGSPERLTAMSEAARCLGAPDASMRVADLALMHAGRIAGASG